MHAEPRSALLAEPAPRRAPPGRRRRDPHGPGKPARRRRGATYRQLEEAAGAVVAVRTRAIGNARSQRDPRAPSDRLRRPHRALRPRPHHRLPHPRGGPGGGHRLQRPDAAGDASWPTTTPRASACCAPSGRSTPKPVRLGASEPSRARPLMVATGGEAACRSPPWSRAGPSRATGSTSSTGRIFTAPPRDGPQRRGAHQQGRRAGGHRLALRDGRMKPGERLPGNMFVPSTSSSPSSPR